MKKQILRGAALLSGMALLTACGGGGETAASDAGGEGGLEKTELTVGVLPIADYASLYWADEKGYFEEAGLSVEFEPLQGGPVGVQKVVSGELDLSFSNLISSTVANDGGAPVVTVVLTSSVGDGGIGVYVTEDSDINSIEDLDGKTIGINTTNAIGDVAFERHTDTFDLDVEPVWVEVPFNEMVAGVGAGSLDAGYSPEPYLSAAEDAGMRMGIVDLTEAGDRPFPISTFVSSQAWVDENPNTAAAFADAMYAAGADIAENEEEFRSWLPGVIDISEESAENMVLPVFHDELHIENVQYIVDLLLDQERIESEIDANDITFTGGE